MREKSIPFRSLPLGIVIWERLVKPKPKPKFAKKIKRETKCIPSMKWKGDVSMIRETSNSSTRKEFLLLLQNETNENKRTLTELQKHMIRIVKEHGSSASIDTLVDEVQKIWNKIFKGEEMHYLIDSRTAVFATLTNSSNDPVFVRDLEKGEGWWKLGRKASQFDFDEMEEDSTNLLEKIVVDDENIPNKENQVLEVIEELQEKKRKQEDSPDTTLNDEEEEEITLDGKEMSQLQGLMIEAMVRNGGSTSIENIQKYVGKFWANLRRRDTNLYSTDFKKAVKSTLLSDNSIFKKDPDRENYWTVTKNAMDLFETVKEQVTEIPRLTGMQDMLMRILLTYGGVCTFEQIYDEVIKTGKSMRHLGADYKRVSRAILASLSHNPPGNFRKASDGCWTIAPKAMIVAEQMSKEDPNYSIKKIKQDEQCF